MDMELADTAEWPSLDKVRGRPQVKMDCSGQTHPGLVRHSNEDHFIVGRFGRFLTPMFTNIADPALADTIETGYALVVADGVSGHRGGAVASAMAIRTLHQLVLDTCDWIISAGTREAELVMQRMAERYQRIDAELTTQGEANRGLQGMATTMTLACNVSTSLILAHVGDSRAYLLRAGQLHQLTRDHTKAQAMLERGVIRRLEEAPEAMRHALMRVIGSAGKYCEADVDHVTLVDGDQILLCTDGLSGMLDDTEITSVLREASDAQAACERLIASALQNGGKDNVTVALARCHVVPDS